MTPEFSRIVHLARLPPEGREERLAASAGECAALARRFAIPAVNRFEARVLVRPAPGMVAAVTGRLSAEVVQDCVVTLEPVLQQVEEVVDLRILPPGQEPSEDPEAPDEIEALGETLDLGEALAEQLALALDPYPRAAGASLAAPEEEEGEAPARGPFAGLAPLGKRR